jgi:hypothetical protein
MPHLSPQTLTEVEQRRQPSKHDHPLLPGGGRQLARMDALLYLSTVTLTVLLTSA